MKSASEKSRRFESRRNTVTLTGGRIKKVFGDAEAAQHEWNVLMLLHKKGVAVPEILELRENVLYLQYCPGPLFLDRVLALEEKGNRAGLEALHAALARWFAGFYEAVPGHIRGDVNFRNFIVGVPGIIGIDFETLPTGQKETDLGNLLAYYAAYSPAFTPERTEGAKMLLRAFLSAMSLDKETALEETRLGFQRMEKRRKGFDVQAAQAWLAEFEKEVKDA